MACFLRATGRSFHVDEFCAVTTLIPCRVFRKGQPRFPRSEPTGPKHAQDAVNIEVSSAATDQVDVAIRDAISFLRVHFDDVQYLRSYPGVEFVSLDFGIAWRNVALQTNLFPAELITLAGQLCLDFEVTYYPPSDDEDDHEGDEDRDPELWGTREPDFSSSNH